MKRIDLIDFLLLGGAGLSSTTQVEFIHAHRAREGTKEEDVHAMREDLIQQALAYERKKKPDEILPPIAFVRGEAVIVGRFTIYVDSDLGIWIWVRLTPGARELWESI